VNRKDAARKLAKHLKAQYGHLVTGNDAADWRADAELIFDLVHGVTTLPVYELKELARMHREGKL
jgi:hypothetical protein